MINSRNIADLDPQARAVAEKHIFACAGAGIDIIITSTWRDIEQQDFLYAIGRSPGDNRKHVTNAKGGQSWHQFRCAWDVVPIVGGKCVWEDPVLWEAVISIGESVGAEAGARWKTFPDRPHFQHRPGALTLEAALERFNTSGTIFI
jgi:peptidoglycan L-alanyl-D-glutamate endopeptidase CwlK